MTIKNKNDDKGTVYEKMIRNQKNYLLPNIS